MLATLDAARLPCAPVQDVDDLLAHAELAARSSLVALGERHETSVPAPHPQLSATPATIRSAGRDEPGTDTEAVLASWLAGRT